MTCKFLARACELLRTDQHVSSASHLRKDRQTERANRTLEDMLRHPINPAQHYWDVKMPCCECAVNDARNIAAGSTFFFLNLRDYLRTHVSVMVVIPLTAANSIVGRVSAAVSSEHDLLNAQQCMTKNAE